MLGINRYENAVKTLLENEGPFAAGLPEQLETLGLLQQRKGDHQPAIETFNQALHIMRVNKGLFTLDQIALVNRIIDSQAALDDLAAIDDKKEYLYYLHQRNYGPSDPRMIAALKEWADWNVSAYQYGIDAPLATPFRITNSDGFSATNDLIPIRSSSGTIGYVPTNQLYGNNTALTNSFLQSGNLTAANPYFLVDPRLRKAEDLYEEMEDLLEQSAEPSDPRLLEAKRSLASISYVIRQEMNYSESRMTSNNLFYNRVAQPQDVNMLLSRGYSKGRKLLEDNLQKLREAPDTAPETIAAALFDLADWHLTFDRPQRAFTYYEQAYQELDASGLEPEARHQPLSQPIVQIPVYAKHPYTRATLGLNAGSDIDYDGYIDVELDVDKYGNVKHSKITAVSPGTEFQLRSILLRNFRSARYRPALVEGKPVEQEELKLRYYYAYQQ
ncbi:MAG: hypothetical protein RQ899_08960 [Pseudomonadales bacterium]|nr:hypothetical protein [Pseudomonadales bacterium]